MLDFCLLLPSISPSILGDMRGTGEMCCLSNRTIDTTIEPSLCLSMQGHGGDRGVAVRADEGGAAGPGLASSRSPEGLLARAAPDAGPNRMGAGGRNGEQQQPVVESFFRVKSQVGWTAAVLRFPTGRCSAWQVVVVAG